jgi:hypothetical protein
LSHPREQRQGGGVQRRKHEALQDLGEVLEQPVEQRERVVVVAIAGVVADIVFMCQIRDARGVHCSHGAET